MNKLDIIIDCDGVLRDIVSKTLEIYKREVDPKSKSEYFDVDTYDMKKAMPLVNVTDFFYRSWRAEEIFTESKPYEKDIVETLLKLQKEFRIHIASHQYKGNEQYTINWLEKYSIPYDSITFTPDKSIIKADFIVDDYPKNLESICKDSCLPILMDQPWNRYTGEYKRITSLKKLVN